MKNHELNIPFELNEINYYFYFSSEIYISSLFMYSIILLIHF